MWTHFMDMHSGGGSKIRRRADGTFVEGSRFSTDGEEVCHVYIEAPEDEAKVIFYNRFGHNPERISCTCCGEDYSISSSESLKQLTGFERGCRHLVTPRDPVTGLYQNNDPVILARLYLDDDEEPPQGYSVDTTWSRLHQFRTLEEYMKEPDVLFIPATHIKPEERTGDIPEQGYVWVD